MKDWWTNPVYMLESIIGAVRQAVIPCVVAYAVFAPEKFGNTCGVIAHAFLMVFGVK